MKCNILNLQYNKCDIKYSFVFLKMSDVTDNLKFLHKAFSKAEKKTYRSEHL